MDRARGNTKMLLPAHVRQIQDRVQNPSPVQTPQAENRRGTTLTTLPHFALHADTARTH